MLVIPPIAAFWLFLAPPAGLSGLGERVAVGLGVTLAFALLARWLRAVNWSGAAAGALVTLAKPRSSCSRIDRCSTFTRIGIGRHATARPQSKR